MGSLGLSTSELLQAAQAEADQFDLPEDWRDGRTLRQGFVAIDPFNAPDIDDAIALTEGENQGAAKTLHVAIADVSFLAKSKAIGFYAQRRTKTLYRGSIVAAPMIPRSISEDRLSLLAGQERPTLTVSIPLDEQGRVCRTPQLTRDVIAAEGLSYGEADKIMLGNQRTKQEITLRNLGRVARQLYSNRHGGDPEELPVLETEEGDISSCVVSPAKLIVQESMILAGIVMSEFMQAQGLPAVYRNHVVPLLDTTDVTKRRSWGKNFRANYGTHPLGHAAIRTESYMHFTSPLRRFVDYANHLNLAAFLEERRVPYSTQRLQRIVDRTNALELKEAETEREQYRAQRKASRAAKQTSSMRWRAERLIGMFNADQAQPSDIDMALFGAVGSEEQTALARKQAAYYAATNVRMANEAVHIAIARGHLRPLADPSGKRRGVLLEDLAGNVYQYPTRETTIGQSVAAAMLIGTIAGVEVEPVVPPQKTREERILSNGLEYLKRLTYIERRIGLMVQHNCEPDNRAYCGLLVKINGKNHLFEAIAASKSRAERQAAAAAIQDLDLLGAPPEVSPAKYVAYKDSRDNPVVKLSITQQKAAAPLPQYAHEPSEKFPGAFCCTVMLFDKEGIATRTATGIGTSKKAASQQAALAMLSQIKPKKGKKKKA